MDAGSGPPLVSPNTRVVSKPFDAAALAEQLVQETELARLSKQERSLLSKTRDLAALVQSSFEAIVGLDTDGRVILWNPGAESLYGFSEQDMLGKLVSVLDSTPVTWPRLIDGEKHVVQRRRRHRNGLELSVMVSRSRVSRSALDSALAYTEVSLDVTAKVQLEKELEHSMRLAHLGRIAATMSHELNNPLSVVLSCADWFASRFEASECEETREVARDLEVASKRISSYVTQITGFVRRDGSSRTQSSFANTLDCALRLVRPRAAVAEVRITIHDQCLADVIVSHDSGRLTHALVNLLSNAIDAAKQGGRTVDLSIHQRATRLEIVIEDDGPGIAPEIAAHLFEPFTTTKPYGEGTGLGLALTREVLREHGGTATLTNRKPRGAVATLYIPLNAKNPLAQELSP
jgi:PAS domain S-box-containing protein